MNKFDAAKIFNDGVKAALFSEPLPEHIPPLFERGYEFGLSVKGSRLAAMNAALIELGFEPIGMINFGSILRDNQQKTQKEANN